MQNSESHHVVQAGLSVLQELRQVLEKHPESFQWSGRPVDFDTSPPTSGKMYETNFNDWRITMMANDKLQMDGAMASFSGTVNVIHIPSDIVQLLYSTIPESVKA